MVSCDVADIIYHSCVKNKNLPANIGGNGDVLLKWSHDVIIFQQMAVQLSNESATAIG